MFKALMGGGRSSSDARGSTDSGSKSGSRRKTGSKSSASPTVSRKSSRGDDRDRGLGDLSSYPSSSGSRSRRYAESAAGESVASSYATAQPNFSEDRIIIERTPKRRESDDDERDDRYRDEWDKERKSESRRDRSRSERAEDSGDRDSRRRERAQERAHPEESYLPPLATGAVPPPVTAAPYGPIPTSQEASQPPFPITSTPGQPGAPSPSIYDPHVQQQFPGQVPNTFAEPYRPPNPAGEAADYYGDQGQSVAEQPGVRPKPPLVIPNSQAHLMTASPTANPPPEPSSVGGVGAAADYFSNNPELDIQTTTQPSSGPSSKPPKPSKPSRPSTQAAALGATAAAATYGVGSYSEEQILTESPSTYAVPAASNTNKPPHSQSHSHSHGVGAAVGAAAAGAAAGYMLGHHNHSSSSSDHVSQYTMQNPDDISQVGPGHSGPPGNPALYAAGAAGAAGAAYAASPLHPHHAAIYHGSPFQSGAMAFQQRQRGPLDKFMDFWRDPEGVGKFEDYTEAIGVCKYCFEPGTTSKDAPRTHHYRRRRSSDRVSAGSRVEKLSRYASSEDEGRRRKSSKSSWLPAILGGYAVKSLFDSKDFDDSYSVKSGRVVGAYPDSESTSASGRRSKTSRGVYKRSYRSRSQERIGRAEYHDSKVSGYDGSRVSARSRSRSRSRSSSRSKHHTLRDAAIGAAIGTAAVSVAKARRRSRSRSRSPRKSRHRKSSSSSSSSFVDISKHAKRSTGFGSFFTASSENRKRRSKRRKSIFSFTNSSSSSVDNDLAFGSGYTRKLISKSKRRGSKEKKEKGVDAKLLALGATATVLAGSSPRPSRRVGEVLVGHGSRSGRSDYTSSASNDDGWEDLDSEDQASSVSSALAFGASGHFARDDSHSSDSSSSGWGWGWGSKGKKKKSKRRSSSESRFPTGAAVAAGVGGALGTAALASGYHRDSKDPSQAPSSSTGSLQQVASIPTSDPSRFDAIPVSSFPQPQPQLIRPGPIPLQQPQPVAPVSQAVYTSQGAPIIPAMESPFPSYEGNLRDVPEPLWNQQSPGYSVPLNAIPPADRRHRRSDSSPVPHTDPLESTTGFGLTRRSTTKEQASVQFDLTQEQEDKERRAERLEKLKRDLDRDLERQTRIELSDKEGDVQPRDGGYKSKRSRERETDRERNRRFAIDDDDDLKRDKDSSSSSWAGPITAGVIGAAAASTVLAGTSKDDDLETSERRHKRREKRRAERRGAKDPTPVSSVSSVPTELPERPKPREVIEERASSVSPSDHVKTSAFRNVGRKKSVYDDYATFFYPEELRHSPDSHSRRESPTMPTIIEIEPASESKRDQPEEPPSEFKNLDRLPWPVPVLRVIGPTPPHSVSGSVRDISSPVITPSEIPEEEKEPERPTGSRVSWGEHQTHEYEVPSTSSERSSIDLDERRRFSVGEEVRDAPIGYTYIGPSATSTEDVNSEIEFAATVAAAAQAAGFDPSLITEDPIFRTRTSPPGSDIRSRSISPTTKVPLPQEQFHGFVEGEVESPETPKKSLFRDTPIFTDPQSAVSETQVETSREVEAPVSVEQPVLQAVNLGDADTVNKEIPEDIPEPKDVQEKPETGRRRHDPESPAEEELSMPGGFDSEESPKKPKRRSTSPIPETAPLTDEPGPLRRSGTDLTDPDLNDIPEETKADEDGSEGKKKKRRKRRSKRESDTVDDNASVTSSSVATGDSEKRRSTDDKSKKSGGFLSSIFGSRVSEPVVESKSAPENEKMVSREVQSEIGPRSSDELTTTTTRRRRHRSSSRGESLDGEDSLTADKENINVESYKSSRQRREDRRRQRYGEMVGLGETAEYEKDPGTSQGSTDRDRDQSFLVERPEMPPTDDHGDYDGASGPSSSMDLRGKEDLLWLGSITRRPRSHSTSPPSSQKIVTDSAPRSVSPGPTLERDRGEGVSPGSRRPSVLRFADSPTAVPLHFRPPPTSPRLQRSPSITTSPTAPVPAPSPSSPSQGRRSRPNSTEFKNSREIRPLFLVERHGASRIENQLDEPLPSLPSSKSASFEDLTALPDENSWEATGLSREYYEAQQPAQPYYEHEPLGSQQNTPTRTTFNLLRHLSRKDELGYEFHSPSELLQDTSSYPDLPPSPGILPSVEGSALGLKDEDGLERDLESLPPLPDSRPSTPEDKIIGVTDTEQTTPTQTQAKEIEIPTTDIPGLHAGPGFAGVVDAAVAAAVASSDVPYPDADLLEKSKSQVYDAEDEDAVRTVTGDDIPALTDVSPPKTTVGDHSEFSSARAGPWGFGAVVEAALVAHKEATGDEDVVSGEKHLDDVADTTEDEFFDAAGSPEAPISRDEFVAEEERQRPDMAQDVPGFTVESPVSKEAFEDVKESRDERETGLEPETVKIGEAAPEITVPAERTSAAADTPAEETTEPPAEEPSQPSSSKKNKKKKKKKGKSVDLGNQGEVTPLEMGVPEPVPAVAAEGDARGDVLASETDVSSEVVPEQAPAIEELATEPVPPAEEVIVSEREANAGDDQPPQAIQSKVAAEGSHLSEEAVAFEGTAVPEETLPSEVVTAPEQPPTVDRELPSEEIQANLEHETSPPEELPAHEIPGVATTEDALPVEKSPTTAIEPAIEESKPQDIPEPSPESSKAVEVDAAQPEEPEGPAAEASLSKTAKKRKKKKAAAAAAAATAAATMTLESPIEGSLPVEEGPAQPEDAVMSGKITESTESTESTRAVEDAAEPVGPQQISVSEELVPAADILPEQTSDHPIEIPQGDQEQAHQPLEQIQESPVEAISEEATAQRELSKSAIQEPEAESEQQEEFQSPEAQADDENQPHPEAPVGAIAVSDEPVRQSQDSPTTTDIAIPSVQTEAFPKANEPKVESEHAQPEAEVPLTRKASKKKKKNKRKSITEALHEPEPADAPHPEPETLEKIEPEAEARTILDSEEPKPKESEDSPAGVIEISPDSADTGEITPEFPKDTADESRPTLVDDDSAPRDLGDASGEYKEVSTETAASEHVFGTADESQPADLVEKAEDIPEYTAQEQVIEAGQEKENRKSTAASELEPETEPKTKPEQGEPATGDIAAPRETSGQLPASARLDDNEQVQEEPGTREQIIDNQAVASIPEDVEKEPSQSVEYAETNDSEPHVSERPTVEPEAGEPSSTGKKSKKKKNKKKSVFTTPEESSVPEIVEVVEPEAPTVEEAAHDAAIETPAAPEEPLTTPTPAEDPAEMSRDIEVSGASGDAPVPGGETVLPQAEQDPAPPMTAAQKKKAKKERKKKRQSLAVEETGLAPSEPVVGTEAHDAPVDVEAQEVAVAEAGREPSEGVAPRLEEITSEPLQEEIKEPVEQIAQEPVLDQVAEQPSEAARDTVQQQVDEQITADQPVTAGETEAIEAAEPDWEIVDEVRDVVGPSAAASATEESATEAQDPSDQPGDKTSEPQVSLVTEEQTGLAPDDVPVLEGHDTAKALSTGVTPTADDKTADEQPKNDASPDFDPAFDAAAIEPQEDTQEQHTDESPGAAKSIPEIPTEETQPTSSKKEKKKKKKKPQSVSTSIDEAESTTTKEESATKAPATPADRSSPDDPVPGDDTAIEGGDGIDEAAEDQARPPTSLVSESQEPEKTDELQPTSEVTSSAPLEGEQQPAPLDQDVRELPTELEHEQPTTAQEELVAPLPDALDPTKPSTHEEPEQESTEPREQEQPTEEPQTATSKKKNKKKKKKTHSTSLDDGTPTPATEEPVSEGPTETITEAPITSEPEDLNAAEGPQPATSEDISDLAPESSMQEAKGPETQDVPPTEEVQTATSKKKAKKDKKKRKSVSFATEEASGPAEPTAYAESTPDPSIMESTEPIEPELEVSKEPEELLEQPCKSSDTEKLEESAPSHAPLPETGVTGLLEEPAAAVTPEEESEVTEEPLADEAVASDTIPQSTVEPSDIPEQGEEAAVAQNYSEELLKEQADAPEAKEGTTSASIVQEIEVVKEATELDEPEATVERDASDPLEPNTEPAESTEPDIGTTKSKKDKKKKKRKTLELKDDEIPAPPEPFEATVQGEAEIAIGALETKDIDEPAQEPEKQDEEPKSVKSKKKSKKEKKRQSKLLALETESSTPTGTAQSPDSSEEKPLAPETPAESIVTEEVPAIPSQEHDPETVAPAETAISLAEEDGKEHQSHDAEFHAEADKDLTWTDNDVSSQVEQQQTVSTEPEREKVDVETVITEPIEGATVIMQAETVGQSQEPAAEVGPLSDVGGTGAVTDEVQVVPTQDAGESEIRQEHQEGGSLEKEAPVEFEPEQQKDPQSTAEPVQEQPPEEVVSQPERDSVKEVESNEPAAEAVESEFAVPTRKLSKKQRKKQRQAQKVAALQEQDTETTLDAPEPDASDTAEEQKPEQVVSREGEDESTVPDEIVIPEETVLSLHGKEIQKQPSESAIPEATQENPPVPGTSLVQEEATAATPEESQEYVLLEPSEPTVPGIAEEATTGPEETVQHTEALETQAAEPEHEPSPVVEGEGEKGRAVEIPVEPTNEDDLLTGSQPLPADEGAAQEEPADLEPPKEDVPSTSQDQEEPSSATSKKKKKKSKKKVSAQIPDAADADASKEVPAIVPDPVPEQVIRAEVVEEALKDNEIEATPLETVEPEPQAAKESKADISEPQIPEPDSFESTQEAKKPTIATDPLKEAPPAHIPEQPRSDTIWQEEQGEARREIEQEVSQLEAPEPASLATSKEEELTQTPSVATPEAPSEDKIVEAPNAPEEPILSRKQSKKQKKKAKKQAKAQLEEAPGSANTETAVEDVAADVKPADIQWGLAPEETAETEQKEETPAEESVTESERGRDVVQESPVEEKAVAGVAEPQRENEPIEVRPPLYNMDEDLSVAQEITVPEDERIADVILDARKEGDVIEVSSGVPEETIKEAEISQDDFVQQEVEVPETKDRREVGMVLEEQAAEPEMRPEVVEVAVEENLATAENEKVLHTEPEPEPASVSRKLSKKEKRKLKKQAASEAADLKEPQAAGAPTELVQPVDEDISNTQTTLDAVEVEEQERETPAGMVEAESSAPRAISEAAEMKDPESGVLVDEVTIPHALEKPKDPAPESLKEDSPPLSRKLSKKEKKKRKGKGAKVEEPLEVAEPSDDTALKAVEVTEARQDEDAWPPIDWAKEIPEFKESAIPEALMERPGETPQQAAKENTPRTRPESSPKETVPKPSKIASIFPNLERGMFRRPSPTQSAKDGAEEETVEQASRDSAIQVLEAPIAREVELPAAEVRDSGYIPSPVLAEDDVFGIPTTRELPSSKAETALQRPPEIPEESRSIEQDARPEPATPCELRRSPSIHGRHEHQRLPWTLEEPTQSTTERNISPPRPLDPIAEQEPGRAMARDGTPRLEMNPEHVLPRPETPVRKFTENALGRRAWPTPDNSDDDWEKVQKPSPRLSPERGIQPEILKTPEHDKPVLRPSGAGSARSSSHSLRRVVHSASGDLRTAALAVTTTASEALEGERQSRPATPQPSPGATTRSPTDLNVERLASSSSHDPVTDKGKKPVRSMTDVYEGWGETPSSPRSPSRPPSVRHRRSMQHLQELEFRLEHLIAENRELAAARDAAESRLHNASLARRKSDHALNSRDADLRDREAELEQLKQSVEWFQKEVARLNEENKGLTTTNATLITTHTQEVQSMRQSSTREVEHLRSQNERLSGDLHERIKQEIETALGQKNAELRRLREELESARDKVKELQQQISASMNDNVIAFRGEDYFEAACQKLCGHVQQWVLRFSKHSDHRRCRRLIDVQDEKIADRFDNAILDGSDTDAYLGDRVRRRDVFMSVVMTMVWEFVFTRYLFGMDREQRQKLKSLEKQLIEVGPRNAIHRWRATTLTLLSRRPAFAKQRESDTEAVTLEIFETLSRLLPPPSQVEAQLVESLRKVLRVAVNLSIEMRTQLAEFIMLPPLQPEYDTNGDLARQVFFNASLMNERSGETTSNDELQAQNAVVRVVLFPLVVKKGNDAGEGDDEVVVCPAQVLVARPDKEKRLTKMASGDRMSIEASRSVHSIAPSVMDMSMNMSMSNVI
ncbi:involucrin repeat protein [Aspergillus lucknowensis]|uniref:Involucrin repeat protein n=1 Tax=Aspergillus lucknowensis TaxID=176173 RepID=A0ABR4M6R8_9EURO